MEKFKAIMQILVAVLLFITTGVTIHNLWNIATRPETISVVNTIIGQGVLIVCLPAFATVLLRKGWKAFNAPSDSIPSKESPDQ